MKDIEKTKTEKDVEASDEYVIEPQSEEHEKILDFFKTVKFRKKLIGGLDARSVWKKFEELNKLYDAAINAEKIRFRALLDERANSAVGTIDKKNTNARPLKDISEKDCSDLKPTSESSDEEG